MMPRSGAGSPEELETLLEDALICRDPTGIAALFEAGAALAAGNAQPARGGAASAQRALGQWGGNHPYLATPRQVVVARDLALVVGSDTINVARRDQDGVWRFVIVWQATATREGEPT